MKVAANDVERILMAAKAATVSDERSVISDDLSFADRVAAFKRAAELSAAPSFWCRVKGAKSGVYRSVLVLRGERNEKGNTYVECLVPYTNIELDHRRVSRILRRGILNKKYKLAGTRQPETPWPCHFHTQFIRKDRLEDMPS